MVGGEEDVVGGEGDVVCGERLVPKAIEAAEEAAEEFIQPLLGFAASPLLDFYMRSTLRSDEDTACSVPLSSCATSSRPSQNSSCRYSGHSLVSTIPDCYLSNTRAGFLLSALRPLSPLLVSALSGS